MISTLRAGEAFQVHLGPLGPGHQPPEHHRPLGHPARRDHDHVDQAVVGPGVGEQRDVRLQHADVADHDGPDPALDRFVVVERDADPHRRVVDVPGGRHQVRRPADLRLQDRAAPRR